MRLNWPLITTFLGLRLGRQQSVHGAGRGQAGSLHPGALHTLAWAFGLRISRNATRPKLPGARCLSAFGGLELSQLWGPEPVGSERAGRWTLYTKRHTRSFEWNYRVAVYHQLNQRLSSSSRLGSATPRISCAFPARSRACGRPSARVPGACSHAPAFQHLVAGYHDRWDWVWSIKSRLSAFGHALTPRRELRTEMPLASQQAGKLPPLGHLSASARIRSFSARENLRL